MQNAGQGVPARRNPRTIEGKARPMPNASHQKSLNEYQSGLQWMHEGKYEKARVVFEKLKEDGPPEILERVRVYLSACQRHAQQSGLSFNNTEEQYDYAISLLNTGFYEEARDQFHRDLCAESRCARLCFGLIGGQHVPLRVDHQFEGTSVESMLARCTSPGVACDW